MYRPNGDHIGTIERVMIDKVTGKVAYAVMSFGGILGLSKDRYPVPWSLLAYNAHLGGYELEIEAQQLKGAPRFGEDEPGDFADRERESELYTYYGVTPYW